MIGMIRYLLTIAIFYMFAQSVIAATIVVDIDLGLTPLSTRNFSGQYNVNADGEVDSYNFTLTDGQTSTIYNQNNSSNIFRTTPYGVSQLVIGDLGATGGLTFGSTLITVNVPTWLINEYNDTGQVTSSDQAGINIITAGVGGTGGIIPSLDIDSGTGGSVTVVPLPASSILFMSGIVALSVIRRKVNRHGISL